LNGAAENMKHNTVSKSRGLIVLEIICIAKDFAEIDLDSIEPFTLVFQNRAFFNWWDGNNKQTLALDISVKITFGLHLLCIQ
jgi:hypothetical protein